MGADGELMSDPLLNRDREVGRGEGCFAVFHASSYRSGVG